VSEKQPSTEIRKHWFGKTLAAAALAFAMVPGSAFALATFDAEAFADTFVTLESGLELTIFTAFDDSGSIGSGTFTVDDETSNVEIDPLIPGILTFTGQTASVAGSASPAAGGSDSSVFAENGLDFLIVNPTADPLNVTFDIAYGASVMTGVTEPALENAGAIATILIGSILGGDVVDVLLDSFQNPNPVDEFLSLSLTVPAGSSDGLYLYISAEGLATAGEPAVSVPVPATFALLGLGLFGMNAQRKRLNARA
jgi:hypothetical protein